MNYKEHELFKLLDGTERRIEAKIENHDADYDMKYVFSVVDGELQTDVFAILGKLEPRIDTGKKHEEEMFVKLCEQIDKQQEEQE